MTLNSEQTSARPRATSMGVVPTRAALGAEITGIDLKDLDEVGFARLLQAWHDRSVLLVRGQTLSDQDLVDKALFAANLFAQTLLRAHARR